MTGPFELEYHGGSIEAVELQRLADQAWEELRTDPEARSEAVTRGVEVSSLDFDLPSPISIRAGRAGVDPLSTTILVGFATSLSASTTIELWKAYMLPRIREWRGQGALKGDPIQDD